MSILAAASEAVPDVAAFGMRGVHDDARDGKLRNC